MPPVMCHSPSDTFAHDPAAAEMSHLAASVMLARDAMVEMERAGASTIQSVHPSHRGSAANLLHYLGLRQHDLRPMHKKLATLGLSSLGRTEAAALACVDAVLRMLSRASGSPAPGPVSTPAPRSIDGGRKILDANAARALGPRPKHRAVRIMVTMPAEAATDPAMIPSMVAAGMNIMRINCAHDGPAEWLEMIARVRAVERETGARCLVSADLAGPKIRVAALATPSGAPLKKIRIRKGDTVHLMRGEPPHFGESDPTEKRPQKRPVRIWCTAPEAVDVLAVGHRVWFDDGAMGGVVASMDAERVIVAVTQAPPDGGRLRVDKGINVPDVPVSLPALTEEDLANLTELVDHVDAFALSFAHTPQDILMLQRAIESHSARRPAIVLKLETRAAFERLPDMLFALMRWECCAIMIARGDLAVECGYERLSEVQEEIIWLAEACHIPAIWATQVLETLAHTGVPTRAEITDAAMAQRAECVMLNKGPYIIEAITLLDDILRRMEAHQRKKTPLLRPLRIAGRRRKRADDGAEPAAG